MLKFTALTKTQSLVWHHWAKYSRECPRGSGYCEDQGVTEQRLTQWHLFGFCVWQRREDIREVMPHEWIHSATLGSQY